MTIDQRKIDDFIQNLKDRGGTFNHQNNDDNIELTQEEVKKLTLAFDKEEFRTLMAEYVTEISDPKYRAEQEEYLRQLEEQNEIPHGKKMIRPTKGYTIEIKMKRGRTTSSNRKKTKSKKSKVFINIVHSEEIKKPTCKVTSSPSKGRQWFVPYSIGPMRMEKDNDNDPNTLISTFDCCFHPTSLLFASKNVTFRDLIAETARNGVVEQFKAMKESVQLDSTYNILQGVQYKNGIPPTMLSSISDVVGHAKNDSNTNEEISESTEMNISSTPKFKESANPLPSSNSSLKKVPDTFGSGMKKGFLQKKLEEVEKSEETNINTVETLENGKVTPSYKMTEQGYFDMADHTIKADNQVHSTRPKFIVYRIMVPGIRSANDLDLNISDDQLSLESRPSIKPSYLLNIDLPYPIISRDGTAKFNKTDSTLVVTLAVRSNKKRIDTTASEEKSQHNSLDDSCSSYEVIVESRQVDMETPESPVLVTKPMEPSLSESPVIVDKKDVRDNHARWLDGNSFKEQGHREAFALDSKLPTLVQAKERNTEKKPEADNNYESNTKVVPPSDDNESYKEEKDVPEANHDFQVVEKDEVSDEEHTLKSQAVEASKYSTCDVDLESTYFKKSTLIFALD